MDKLYDSFYDLEVDIDDYKVFLSKSKKKTGYNLLDTVVSNNGLIARMDFIIEIYDYIGDTFDMSKILRNAMKYDLIELVDAILERSTIYKKEISYYLSTVTPKSVKYLLNKPFILDEASYHDCVTLGKPDIISIILHHFKEEFKANVDKVMGGFFTINSHQSFFHLWFDLFGLLGIDKALARAIIKAIPDFREKLFLLDPELSKYYDKIKRSEEIKKEHYRKVMSKLEN